MPNIHNIISLLKGIYPEAMCSLEYGGDPWRLLIAARLSAQCTDARVNIVCGPLFRKYPTAYDMASADIGELEEIIRPCGLYHTKAESCIAMSKMIVAEHGGEVPAAMDSLLALPGVGRKIANLVLGDIYGVPGIVADTHCIRLNGRFGFYPESLKDPVKVEKILSSVVPPEEQSAYCHRMVLFGREYCDARAPRCGECPLSGECEHAKKNSFTMPVPSPVSFVLERLNSAGFTAYCVGGCVRDSLMGKTPSDYDVTTSAKPEEMQSVFSDCRVVETGLKHGTLTVVLDGMNIEITTYRIDGAYGDCRHPEAVTFTDRLSDDLCRRDFTVNAMAYSPRDSLVDLYGGRDDLAAGVIRCVGRAEERFSEDGLRILRALRFSSVLGFTPDEECSAAVRKLTPLLGKISRERIYAETTKLLGGKNCAPILSSFPSTVAFALGIGEDAVTRAARAIGKDTAAPDPLMRYAILLADLGEKAAASVFDSLKPSRDDRRTVLGYIKYRDHAVTDEYTALRLISETDDGFPARLAHYRSLIGAAEDGEESLVLSLTDSIIRADKCRSLGQLSVSGNDLASLGFTGRGIGQALSALLDKVLRGELPNVKEELLAYAKDGKI